MDIAVFVEGKLTLNVIRRFFKKLNAKEDFNQIDYFNQSKRLLQCASEVTYDLYLIDADLAEEEGIYNLLKEQCGKGKSHCILMAYDGCVPRLPGIENCHYLASPASYDYFERVISRVCRLYQSGGKVYVGRFNRSAVILDIEDIYYVESCGRATYVCTANEKRRVNGTLNIEEEKLPGNQFIRINQGVLINLNQVREIMTDAIRLKNGAVKYISVRRRKKTRQMIERYLGEN